MIVVSCGAYEPPVGYDVASCNSSNYRGLCVLSCSIGYVGSAANVKCGIDGRWTSTSGCSCKYTCDFLFSFFSV